MGDPSDWPAALPHIRELDAAMRCSVCSELFTAPKLLPCGHVCALHVAALHCAMSSHACRICSLCIRRAGDAQQRATGSRQCPECRAPWESSALEAKTIQCLHLATVAFQAARGELLRCAKAAEHATGSIQTRGRKRGRHKPAPGAVAEATTRACTLTATPSRNEQGVDTSEQHADSGSDGSSDWDPDDSPAASRPCSSKKARAELVSSGPRPGRAASEATAALPKGCGSCPICHRTFSLAFLQRHVETCLISVDAAQPSSVVTNTSDAGAPSGKPVMDLTHSPALFPQRPCSPHAERRLPPAAQVPPKVCFTIMKERDVRLKLQEDMERRYGDFRQYVATALDCSDTSSLPQLARRFRKASLKTQQLQDAPVAADSAVAGAQNGFDALIDECRQRVSAARQARGEPVHRNERYAIRIAAAEAALVAALPSRGPPRSRTPQPQLQEPVTSSTALHNEQRGAQAATAQCNGAAEASIPKSAGLSEHCAAEVSDEDELGSPLHTKPAFTQQTVPVRDADASETLVGTDAAACAEMPVACGSGAELHVPAEDAYALHAPALVSVPSDRATSA